MPRCIRCRTWDVRVGCVRRAAAGVAVSVVQWGTTGGSGVTASRIPQPPSKEYMRMQGWRLPLAGALALALGFPPMAPVAAAPAAMSPGFAKVEGGSAVQQVRRYRHFH